MIPSKILGKVAGANWNGLADGTYGFILTLLLIELPAIVLQLLNEKERFVGMQVVAWSPLVVIISYFSVFTIVHDIWSYHKALLLETIKLRLFAIATGWLLFTASLIPPFYFLVNRYGVKEILESTSARSDYLTYFRFIVFCLIFTIYVLLAVLAKTENGNQVRVQKKEKNWKFFLGQH